MLAAVFTHSSKAQFHCSRETKLHSIPALVFDFKVAAQNNRLYFLDSRDKVWFPEYKGQIWIDARTSALLRLELETALTQSQIELDQLTQKVIAAGIASWSGGEKDDRQLIVRGQANLLEDVTALADLERLRSLFEMLETKETVLRLVDASKKAEGVQIFIGAESHLFGVAGCSLIIAPYQNSREQIVGAIGVIGPTRINYARIIPMVDYTAKMIGRLIG